MKRQKIGRRILTCAAMAVGGLYSLPRDACAVSIYGGANGSDWNTATNWTPPAVPGSGAAVSISESPTSTFTVSYDDNYTSANGIATLAVDSTSSTVAVQLNQATSADNLFVTTNETVGSSGKAIFNQSAANNSTAALYLGSGTGGNGTYQLSGGTLTTTSIEFMGYFTAGNFIQTGGTHISAQQTVGEFTGSSGTYTLSGTATDTGTVLYLGYEGTGLFSQLGGTASYTGEDSGSNSVLISGQTAGQGTLNLSGGTFNSKYNEAVGYDGIGTINQTGGANNLSGGSANICIAETTVANGSSYNLSGGTLSVAGNVYVDGSQYGAGGKGSLTITGGTMTVAGTLEALNTTGASINFSAGTVNVANMTLAGGATNLNWTGGTLNFTNSVSIDQFFVLGQSITLATGMALGTSATLTNNGQITLNGGQLTGSGILVNDNLITGSGAILMNTAGFNNYGTVTSTGLITVSNTSNYGLISLAPSQNLFVNLFSVLTNNGTVSLGGGSVNGYGSITNSPGANINGPGTIAVGLTNYGSVLPGNGTLTVSSAWTNAGVVELTNSASSITGGEITNTGTIQGFGNVSAVVANSNGTIEASGGTLVLGSINNPVGSTLAADNGAKLLVSGGLTTNAGIISLTGGTFDNNGFTLNNTGQITGYGVIRTGGLTNNGSITLTGTNGTTTTTVNGNVTNAAGKNINVQYNPAIFTGAVTNNGTIYVTQTTVTFAGTYSGNAYISDPSKNIFQNNATITAGGSMTGGTGDTFIFSGGTLTNNGTFTDAGTVQSADSVTNSGSFTLSGSQTWFSGTTFTNTAGTAAFNSDTGAGGANLAVNANAGTVSFGSTQHLAGLSIAAGAMVAETPGTGRSVLVTQSLSIAATGTLDLGGNDLDVPGGSLATLTSLAKQGFNNGTWTGAGITSTTAAANAKHLLAVGVIQNNQTGSPVYTASNPFDGITPGATDILAKETYYGDANLDGHVDGSDYTLIDNGYLNHLTGWLNGDFNYDGKVDGSDYTLIDNAFNTQGPVQSAALIATSTAIIAGGSTTTSVPEPVSLALLGVAGIALRRRKPTL